MPILAPRYIYYGTSSGLSPQTRTILIVISIIGLCLSVSALVLRIVLIRRRNRRVQPEYMIAPVVNGTGMRHEDRQTYEMLYDGTGRDGFINHNAEAPPTYREARHHKTSSREHTAEVEGLMNGPRESMPQPFAAQHQYKSSFDQAAAGEYRDSMYRPPPEHAHTVTRMNRQSTWGA